MEHEELAKLNRSVLAAEKARQILDDDVLKLAWDAVELCLIQSWIHSQPEDTRLREDCYFQLRALASVKKRLTNQVDRGTVAARSLGGDEEESR